METDCDSATRGPRLRDEYPQEFEFFKQTFVWPCGEGGVYFRTAYEEERLGDFILPRWRPLTNRGRRQKLYTDLVDSLAEKHLDFDRFARTCGDKDRLHPPEYQTAFWVGTTAGPHTTTHALDIDCHDYVGWNLVPTRWHRGEEQLRGPHDYRYLPVVRPSLRFFMTAKLVHDHFPGRIWAFSSGNLGLAVWRVSSQPELTHVVHRKAQAKLTAIGLGGLEHYPQPPKGTGSFGRCHRRPCGMNSGVITPTGLITDPIEQVRWFMSPGGTPSFTQILSAYRQALVRMYDQFLLLGGTPDHRPTTPQERRRIVESGLREMDAVEDWAGRGCPIDPDLVTPPEEGKRTELTPVSAVSVVASLEQSDMPVGEPPALGDDLSTLFRSVDLRAINQAGKWVEFVGFLAENGLPAEDRLFPVVATLARWFGFVEWHGRDRREVKDVLRHYVTTKHNGMISRINAGREQEVLAHVDRIVDYVLDSDDADSPVFEDLRRRRTTGRYATSYDFASMILADYTSPIDPLPLPSYLSCGSLRDGLKGDEAAWEYVPDRTPLPEFLTQKLLEEFSSRGRPLRKRGDSYPTLDAVTEFFNYLLAGRPAGRRRASKELLIKMGFPSNGAKRKRIFDVLTRSGLLRKHGYRSLENSMLWELTTNVMSPTETC